MSNTMILKITRRGCKYPVVQISRKEKDLLAWDVAFPAATPMYCLAMTPKWRVYAICKTCKKWIMALSSSMAMYSVMRDIHNTRRVPLERRLLIYKSIDFRTMGLWKWITIFIALYDWICTYFCTHWLPSSCNYPGGGASSMEKYISILIEQ